jgi:hypothetical protein
VAIVDVDTLDAARDRLAEHRGGYLMRREVCSATYGDRGDEIAA